MPAGNLRLTLDIPPHVAEVVRHLSPDLKRAVKAALRGLATNPHEGSPLVRELEGKWRYRVRRYRVVYEIDREARVLRVLAVGDRRHVYERLSAELSGPDR